MTKTIKIIMNLSHGDILCVDELLKTMKVKSKVEIV